MRNVTEGMEFLNQLIMSMPHGVICFDLEGKISMINQAAIDAISITKPKLQECLETPVTSLVTSQTLLNALEVILLKGRMNRTFSEIEINEKYFEVNFRKISIGTLMFLNDISQVISSKNESVQNLIQGQEIERKRIAKEIHDGVGPDLSAIKMALEGIGNSLEESEIVNKIKNLSNQISEVAQDIRNISHTLMPPSILDFGISSAIENLVRKWENQSILKFNLSIQNLDDTKGLDSQIALNIYRIVQEAIQNSLKHSGAKAINIHLSRGGDDELILRYFDDGKMSDSEKNQGLGLQNMKSRIESLQGKILFTTTENGAFSIQAHVPLKMEI